METKTLFPPNSTFSFHVTAIDLPIRLDKYLCSQFPGYSRNFFQQLITDQFVSLNGTITTKQSTMLKSDDTITITFPPLRKIEPATIASTIAEKNLDIKVLFKHDHFLIIYKPANLLVHRPSTVSTAITLVDWLLLTYPHLINIGYSDRPGIIHRLDKDTSGILIISRTPYAHATFSAMFKNRLIQKTYLAVVQGHPPSDGTIDLPIGRSTINRKKMATFPPYTSSPHNASLKNNSTHGTIRNACTKYRVLEYFKDCSLIEAQPITGRTHQIRVHLATLGHPIVGDPVYGHKSKSIKRQALHAQAISFTFDGTPFSFSNDVPDDFKSLLTTLRKEQ